MKDIMEPSLRAEHHVVLFLMILAGEHGTQDSRSAFGQSDVTHCYFASVPRSYKILVDSWLPTTFLSFPAEHSGA